MKDNGISPLRIFRPLRYLLIGVLTACGPQMLPPGEPLEVASVGVHSGALSNQGEFVIAGAVYHGISYWRLSDGERLFNWSHKPGEDTTLIAADFSPDGRWAVTADIHTLVLWDTQSGAAPRYWRAPGDILSVQLSGDGQHALLGLSDHTAVLFDIRRGGVVRTLHHANRVHSVSLSDDGKIAATGSEDYTAVAWDLEKNQPLAKMRHQDEVQLVTLSPDGSLVLSVSKYDKAVVWQSRDGTIVAEIPLSAGRVKRGLRFTTARFSQDNRYLLTGRPDQIVSLWKLDDLTHPIHWKVTKRKRWKPTGAAIVDVAFTKETNVFYALASNGLVFRLTHAGISAANAQ
jgi:WD40 repeat protein